MRLKRDVLIAVLAFCLGSTSVIAASGSLGLIGSDGVIHACLNGAGMLRVVEPTEACRGSERAISWNQSGGAGTSGPTGPTGATGATGPTGPAGSFPLTSPNGQYSIQLSDAGIVLLGPQASITLANGIVSVRATRLDDRVDNDYVVIAGGTFDVNANSHVNIRSSATATMNAGGPVTISGATTTIGNTGCGPALRQTDQAIANVGSGPGAYPVVFVTGSSDVILC